MCLRGDDSMSLIKIVSYTTVEMPNSRSERPFFERQERMTLCNGGHLLVVVCSGSVVKYVVTPATGRGVLTRARSGPGPCLSPCGVVEMRESGLFHTPFPPALRARGSRQTIKSALRAETEKGPGKGSILPGARLVLQREPPTPQGVCYEATKPDGWRTDLSLGR
jgi:hypothetical protein